MPYWLNVRSTVFREGRLREERNSMNKFQFLFDLQKNYFNSNATKSYEWRMRQLDNMSRMLAENQQRFQDAVSADFKTAIQEQVFEVAAPLGIIERTKQKLAGWMEPVAAEVPVFLAKTGHKGMVYREPYGVALIMGPFNGPLVLLLDPAITALAAGNTCILKLSEAAARTSAVLAELIPKYFDPEAVSAVSGNRDEIAELLKIPFDFIFFTGSIKVGKVVMRAAAENLTPVLLELGGQNPALVDRSANIADAARKIVWGATAWGGQWCTSPGYAYVHESIADEFVTEAKKALLEFYGEDPRSNPDYSRIISSREVSRLASLIDADKVVAGGTYDLAQRYINPTVLYPVSWADKIMDEEIFGPLLPIMTFSDVNEAISEIKARPKPLAAFVFSRDQAVVDEFLSSVSFGGGAVNQTNVELFIDSMPFGGVGTSGIGHYYGKYGFDSLTHAKSVLISAPDIAIDHLFPPFTEEKVLALKQWFIYE
jgi:aldehyde dehydrogenase (NAD+)